MKKLQLKDLTPELLDEVSKLENPEAVIKYFEGKDFEISADAAKLLFDESKKGNVELSDETLASVAGGGLCGDGKKQGTKS